MRPDVGAGLLLDDPLEAMAASVSDELYAAVRKAMRRLSEPHVRILQRHSRDGLDPEAIVGLEGLTSIKQEEGRHRRAVKALGR